MVEHSFPGGAVYPWGIFYVTINVNRSLERFWSHTVHSAVKLSHLPWTYWNNLRKALKRIRIFREWMGADWRKILIISCSCYIFDILAIDDLVIPQSQVSTLSIFAAYSALSKKRLTKLLDVILGTWNTIFAKEALLKTIIESFVVNDGFLTLSFIDWWKLDKVSRQKIKYVVFYDL